MFKIAALYLAAAFALSGDGSQLRGELHHGFQGATITGYDEMPCCGSGVIMVLRGVEIATADGKTEKLYFIHANTEASGLGIAFAPGPLPYPAIGTKCDFDTTPRPMANGSIGTNVPLTDDDGSKPFAEIVDAARCKP